MEEVFKISNVLKDKGLINDEEYINYFIEKEEEIIKSLTDDTILKSEIYLDDFSKFEDTIKFATIFSDFISVYTLPNLRTPFNIKLLYNYKELNRILFLPSEFSDKERQHSIPAYVFRKGDDLKNIHLNLIPLIESNRLIVRPMRGIWTPNVNHIPKIPDFSLKYANPNTLSGEWHLSQSKFHSSIPIGVALPNHNESELIQLTIPFLHGTNLLDFASILCEEDEHLLKFKIALRKLVIEVLKDQLYATAHFRDLISNELLEIEKKFRKTEHRYQKRANIIFGTFSISLFLLNGLPNADIINKTLGFGGLYGALAINKVLYDEAIDEIKEAPFYLLWKITTHAT